MYANKLRSILLVTLFNLSLLAASSASATPWMVQLQLESTPEGFDVVEMVVTDCEANDMKSAGSGITVEIIGGERGETLQRFEMRDPRMVFIESPDGSRWMHEELVLVGDVLMFPNAFHVLSLPLSTDELPIFPIVVRFTDETGKPIFETIAYEDHIIPGDVHGCKRPEIGYPPRKS